MIKIIWIDKSLGNWNIFKYTKMNKFFVTTSRARLEKKMNAIEYYKAKKIKN